VGSRSSPPQVLYSELLESPHEDLLLFIKRLPEKSPMSVALPLWTCVSRAVCISLSRCCVVL
jgi:hypothetical protein